MSIQQYYTEKLKSKMVYYTGTDSLLSGYALCYDRDNITATRLAVSTVLVAALESFARHSFVEKPASGNLDDFAGFVVDGPKTGPCFVEIVEPDSVPRSFPVFTEENCTIDSTLLALKPGSYILGGVGGEGPIVAKAIQTIDRSSTNGTVQALIFPGAGALSSEVFTASSRAATALPTAGIWDNFPLAAMRTNPFLGSLLEADFRRAWESPTKSSADAAEAMYVLPTTAVGEMRLFATTDNQGVGGQWALPITSSGGTKWAFEARFKQVNITGSKFGYFLGLYVPLTTGWLDIVADDGTITDGGALGFQYKEAATTALDLVYDAASQTQAEISAAIATMAADTYRTVGMYYNGTTIQGYVDGVAAGTAISAANIAAATFPAATILVPTFALKNAHADDATVTLDWIRVAQAP